MYLVHETNFDYLYLILQDCELKSNYLTGKINQGDGVYEKKNKFVYFSLERKLFSNTNYGRIKLYFDIDLLSNRSFYISTVQSAYPENEAMWKTSEGKEIKKKYQKNTKNILEILEKFYYYNNFVFLFGQIAIKNKVNIQKYLVGVEFIPTGIKKLDIDFEKKTKKIMNLLNEKYPLVKINIFEKKNISDYLQKNISNEMKHVKTIILK